MDILGLGLREHVAAVGGGGKTTLCFELARGLARAGKRVIITTTTHVWLKEAETAPCLVFRSRDVPLVNCLNASVKEHGLVFVGERPLTSGKVEGLPPQDVDALFRDAEVDYVIVEADGASDRPIKAPAAHEPVIPSSATLVVGLMGLEAMGERISPELVFRPERFCKLTGLGMGEILGPAALAILFGSAEGIFKGTPRKARKIVWLNKADRLRPGQDPDELLSLLLQSGKTEIERVVVGSLRQGICRVWVRDDQGWDRSL